MREGKSHGKRGFGFAGRPLRRLEAHDYKEGSVIEISAKRLRHSMKTGIRHYADLRTSRGQKAAQEAWETPVVKVSDCGV